MTPTERRAPHSPAVVEAWEWLDMYARHWATTGRDWQTLDNLTRPMRRVGHRDIRSLQTYYNETAESMARLL